MLSRGAQAVITRRWNRDRTSAALGHSVYHLTVHLTASRIGRRGIGYYTLIRRLKQSMVRLAPKRSSCSRLRLPKGCSKMTVTLQPGYG